MLINLRENLVNENGLPGVALDLEHAYADLDWNVLTACLRNGIGSISPEAMHLGPGAPGALFADLGGPSGRPRIFISDDDIIQTSTLDCDHQKISVFTPSGLFLFSGAGGGAALEVRSVGGSVALPLLFSASDGNLNAKYYAGGNDCIIEYQPNDGGEFQGGYFEMQANGVRILTLQQPGVADADGTLASVTARFNELVQYLENHGLIAIA